MKKIISEKNGDHKADIVFFKVDRLLFLQFVCYLFYYNVMCRYSSGSDVKMEIKLCIIDTDTEYIDRFISAANSKENMIISAFTDRDALASSLQTRNYDILLFSPSVDLTGINLKKIAISILLYEDPDRVDSVKFERFPKIMKYQRVSSIISKMLDLYSDVSGSGFGSEGFAGVTKTICVYSPVGGAGKTTVALSLASLIANRGFRVLYLNFESISSYGAYLKQDGGKNMGEVIAGMEKKINISLKIKSIVKADSRGIMYFEEFSSVYDMEEITDEDLEMLVNAVSGSDICDYIIMDMDSAYDKKARRAIQISTANVIVSPNNGFGLRKLDKFFAQYRHDSDLFSKMFIVNNFGGDDSPVDTLISLGTIPYLNGYPFDMAIEHICKNVRLDLDVLIK